MFYKLRSHKACGTHCSTGHLHVSHVTRAFWSQLQGYKIYQLIHNECNNLHLIYIFPCLLVTRVKRVPSSYLATCFSIRFQHKNVNHGRCYEEFELILGLVIPDCCLMMSCSCLLPISGWSFCQAVPFQCT